MLSGPKGFGEAPLADIKDSEELKAGLETQPRKVAAALAVRAALRVLPLVQLGRCKGYMRSLVLPVFRATAVSWAAAKYHAHETELAAAAAAAAVATARPDYAGPAKFAALAALAAADAALAAAAAAAAAVDACTFAENAFNATADDLSLAFATVHTTVQFGPLFPRRDGRGARQDGFRRSKLATVAWRSSTGMFPVVVAGNEISTPRCQARLGSVDHQVRRPSRWPRPGRRTRTPRLARNSKCLSNNTLVFAPIILQRKISTSRCAVDI
jgi:hypothetical protein